MARNPIKPAIKAGLATLMAAFSGERFEDGRARPVRQGHLPERGGMTGIGPVPVTVPRGSGPGSGRWQSQDHLHAQPARHLAGRAGCLAASGARMTAW